VRNIQSGQSAVTTANANRLRFPFSSLPIYNQTSNIVCALVASLLINQQLSGGKNIEL
jgi:hypothetical protein